MKRPRIALFVADPTRDIPGIVLTAFELCQQGAECFVVPFRDGHREICALAPDFVLLPAIRPYQVSKTRQYVAAGIQIGFLDAEGVVWPSMDEYQKTIWADADLTRRIACICAWSHTVAEHMIRTRVFDQKQVTVSGCPRFDFYVRPLAAVYKTWLSPVTGSSRKMVLINTNFSIANPDHGSPQLVIDRLIENYNYDPAEVMKWHNNEVGSIDGMSELANRLAKDFPDLDIVFRPHPQELCATYEDKLEKLPNLKLTNEGSVTAWILRSSTVIQRSCTTAIEATLAGRLAISPQWIAPSNYYPVPEAVSLPSPDYSHLRDVIKRVSAGSFELPEEDKTRIASVVESAFYRTDGMAHKRVAAAIMNKLRPDNKTNTKKCRQFLYGIPDTPSLGFRKLPSHVRYHLRLDPTYSFRKMNGFHEGEPNGFPVVSELDDLAQAIRGAKSVENPRRIKAYPASEGGAYIANRYTGRSVVMACE